VSFQLSLSTESVASAYPDEPLFVAPEASVGEVLQLLRAQNNGSVLVCNNSAGSERVTGEGGAASGKLLGIFTERDALRAMAASAAGGNNLEQAVSTVMSKNPVCLQADTSVSDAITTMSDGGYRHLPIVDSAGLPTGMASVYGIMHYLVDHFPQTIYNLPPEPSVGPSDREGA
jgi:CBS domain-containing protein